MSRRDSTIRWHRALLGGALALGLAAAAGAERDGVIRGQTIARVHDAQRGIVSLGGDLCMVGPSTRLIDEDEKPVTLADLRSDGSPALYEARRSGPRSCMLDLLRLVDKLPD